MKYRKLRIAWSVAWGVVAVLLLVVDRPKPWSTVFPLVPYWSLMLFCVAIAASAWFPYRFSLRTMLIATTLVSAALGTIIAVSR